MRVTRSIIVTAIGLVLLIAVVAAAQTEQNMPYNRNSETMPMMSDSLRIERHLSVLRDSLNLSDTQTEQIRTILANEDQQLVADRQTYGSDTKAFNKARVNLRKNTDKQIKNVLNSDQQKTYDRIEKQMMQTRKTMHNRQQNQQQEQGNKSSGS